MGGDRLPLETWFWEMPTCTRWWTAATVLTSALVQCHMVTPFQLFYSFRAVFVKSQVSRSLCLICMRASANSWMNDTVLATLDDVSVLRPFLTRPTLSHILPTALCATTRRIIREIRCLFLMATPLCHGESDCIVAARLYAVPRTPALIHTRLYLGSSQPRHQAKLPWFTCLHSSVSAVGIDGL